MAADNLYGLITFHNLSKDIVPTSEIVAFVLHSRLAFSDQGKT